MSRKVLAALLALALVYVPFAAAPVSAASYGDNIALSHSAAPEGMVLLKDDNNALPLAKGAKVTLFGQSKNYIKGGTGSGDVNVDYVRTIWDGMSAKNTDGKIVLNPNTYPAAGNSATVTANDVTAAKAVSDTAIYVINRNSGEGGDRSASAGDYYMSQTELDAVSAINAQFDNVIIVLNIGGIMDMTWTENYNHITAVLLGWQGGMEGGLATADVLVGDAYPSGKLTDTFARSYTDYPSSNTIGSFGGSGSVYYREDVYVGYRYFSTADPTYSRVKYEFGYGLAYTTFSISNTSVNVTNQDPNKGNVTVSATVTNTGSRPGKEVVQVYYQAPNGLMKKPARALAAFAKTKELAPGESQVLTMTYKLSDMASYDDTGKTGHMSAYVMENGDYNIYVGNSVKNAAYTGKYTLGATAVTQQLTQELTPVQQFKRLVDPATGQMENAGPAPAPVTHTIYSDKKSVVTAYDPLDMSNNVIYGTNATTGIAYVDGLTNGQYITYSLDVQQAGPHYLSLNYSNANAAIGNGFDIYVDGVLQTGAVVNMPLTASWTQPKDTAVCTVNLPAGKCVLKLAAKSATSAQLNFLTIWPVSLELGVYSVGPQAPTKVTIANYNSVLFAGNASFENIPGTINMCLANFDPGARVGFKLNVAQAGYYDVVFNYANGNAPRTNAINLFLDGSAAALATTPAQINFAQTATGAPNQWYTFANSDPYKIYLPAGTHVLELVSNTQSASNQYYFTLYPYNVISATGATVIRATDAEAMPGGIKVETVPNTGQPTIAFFNLGSYLSYKFSVAQAGTYKFRLNYANGHPAIADPFTITVNGVDQAAQIAMKQTGDGNGSGAWYNPADTDWYDINLPAGDYEVRFTAKTTVGNLNFFELWPSSVPLGVYNVSATAPTKINIPYASAQNFAGYAALELAPNTAGDVCIASFDTGSWFEYTLNVAQAGNYSLVFNYCNGNADNANALTLSLDGASVASVDFPKNSNLNGATGQWYNFGNSAAYNIALPAGTHTLRITSNTSSAGNTLYFTLTPMTVIIATKAASAPAVQTAQAAVTPNPFFFQHKPGDPWKLVDVYVGNCTMDDLVNQFTDAEMADLSQGHGGGLSGGTGLIGGIGKYGAPGLETSDGPAGLRITAHTTAWPIGTMLACTWNDDLLQRIGTAVGNEMTLNGADIWLAPGMDMHRNPLCGRNFEYYSEDPLVTGKSAAAISRGVASTGNTVTLKHYVANDQETARNSGSDSVASERALREIYLKGFQIAVQEGHPLCIMSSYNLVNGTETSERYDLLTTILRNEWGFDGLVMTDWGNNSDNGREAAAGNNVKMSSGSPTAVTNALANGTLTREQLRKNMADIMRVTMALRPFQRLFNIQNIGPDTTVVDAAVFNEVTGTPKTEATTDSTPEKPSGFDVGYMDAGGSLTYYINVERGGNYDLTFRMAGNASPYGQYNIMVDGQIVGTVTGKNTGGWQTFTTVGPVTIPLRAGDHFFRLDIVGGGSNLNWIKFTREDAPTPTRVSIDRDGTNVDANFMVGNNSDTPFDAQCVFAQYGADGRLVAVKRQTVAVGALDFSTAQLSMPLVSEETTFKAFIWDAKSYAPLCDAASARISYANSANLALGAAVRSTDFQSGNAIANAVDSDRTTTRWAASAAGYPRWIEVDLGAVCNLSSLDIYWYVSGTRAYQYKVYGRNTPITDWGTPYPTNKDFSADANYTLLADESANQVYNHTTDSLSGVQARYIAIQVLGTYPTANQGNASMYSIEVAGSTWVLQ